MFYRKPSLAVIFVEYNKAEYGEAFDRLREYLGRLDQERVFYTRVNNRDEGDGTKNVAPNIVELQGDNTDREFSGWQKGVEFLRAHDIPYDVVLFANEAMEAVEPCYLKDHSPSWLLWKSYLLKGVFGLVATRWEKTVVRGKSTRIWLGTHCFFVPRIIVEKLGTVVSVDASTFEEYLPREFPGVEEIFKPTAPINSATEDRIVRWLTREWHSKFTLSESTWPVFRAKANAIINEELLTLRIRELGYFIVPYDVPQFVFRKTRGAFRKAKKTLLAKRNYFSKTEALHG